MKKKSFLILLLVLIATLAFAGGGISVFASESTALTAEQFHMYGVNARLDETASGLRFTAEVDKDVAEEVTKENSGKTFGALIVPYDYLTGNSITVSDDTDYVKAFEEKKITVLTKEDLTPGFREGYTTEGYQFVSCTISNIMDENLNRDFFGIIYIKTVDGDAATYEYASFEEEDESYENVKSIYEISRTYYNEVKSEADKEGYEIDEYLADEQLSALTGFILKAEYANRNDGAAAPTEYVAAYTVEDHDEMVELAETANALVQKGVSTFAGYSIKKTLNDYNAIIDGKTVVNPAVQTAIDALKEVEDQYDAKYALLYESEAAFNKSKIYANKDDNASKTYDVDEDYGYYASVYVNAAQQGHVEITLAQLGEDKIDEYIKEYDVVYLPFWVNEGGCMRYNLNGSGNKESRHDSTTENSDNIDTTNGEYKLGISEFYIMGNLEKGWNYFTIPVSYLKETVMYGKRIPQNDGTYKFAMPVLAKLNESALSTENTKVYEIFDFNGLNNAVINPNYSYVRDAEGKITTIYSYHNGNFVGCNEYQSTVGFTDDKDYGMVFTAKKISDYKSADAEEAGDASNVHHLYQVNFEMINALCEQKNADSFSFYVKYENKNDAVYCFGAGVACNNWTKYTVNIGTGEVTCVDVETSAQLETKKRAGGFDNYIYRTQAGTDQSLYISNFFIEVPVDEAAE